MKAALKGSKSMEKKNPSVLSLEWLGYENKNKKINFNEMDCLINQEYEQMIKK